MHDRTMRLDRWTAYRSGAQYRLSATLIISRPPVNQAMPRPKPIVAKVPMAVAKTRLMINAFSCVEAYLLVSLFRGLRASWSKLVSPYLCFAGRRLDFAGRCLGDARRCINFAGSCLGDARRCLGDARRCLGDASNQLGHASRVEMVTVASHGETQAFALDSHAKMSTHDGDGPCLRGLRRNDVIRSIRQRWGWRRGPRRGRRRGRRP